MAKNPPEWQETEGFPSATDSLQHHAVQLVVRRERERMAFNRQTWWTVSAVFAARQHRLGPGFTAQLTSLAGTRLATRHTGTPSGKSSKHANPIWLDEAAAFDLRNQLERATFTVARSEAIAFRLEPPPPFDTASLLHEAIVTFNWTPRQTMRAGQWLTEHGFLHNVRTRSTALPAEVATAIRSTAKHHFNAAEVARSRRTWGEITATPEDQAMPGAIRPVDCRVPPAAMQGRLLSDELQLYDLIWKRTIASQMAAARGVQRTLTIEAVLADRTTVTFTAEEKSYEQLGFLRAFDDQSLGSQPSPSSHHDMAVGDAVDCRSLEASEQTSQPPARHTEASLAEFLATATGLDADLCANEISESLYGQQNERICLRGNELVATWRSITAALTTDNRFPVGDGCVVCVTDTGTFLEDAEGRQVHLPSEEELAPDELTLTKCWALLDRAKQDEPMGTCPSTGRPVYAKTGRFGPYVQLGKAGDSHQPSHSVSLLPGMELASLDLATALRLLQLPRVLGPHPENGVRVTACQGRFGPYVTCGTESRSLPPEISPLDITLDQAVRLLKQPKPSSDQAVHPSPRTLGISPITNQPVVLRTGRFGPYVSDGTTNASVPKDTVPEHISLNDALHLLAARASSPRARPRPRRRHRPTF